MSRPFSYNDENFTVIGNICFAHILTKPFKKDDKICEIPPEIASRLIQTSAHGTLQTYGHFGSGGNNFFGKIIEENNRYYVSSNTNSTGNYYAMFYLFLKDI